MKESLFESPKQSCTKEAPKYLRRHARHKSNLSDTDPHIMIIVTFQLKIADELWLIWRIR
jgi:hypothetical protein